jgi:hypothetical protein
MRFLGSWRIALRDFSCIHAALGEWQTSGGCCGAPRNHSPNLRDSAVGSTSSRVAAVVLKGHILNVAYVLIRRKAAGLTCSVGKNQNVLGHLALPPQRASPRLIRLTRSRSLIRFRESNPIGGLKSDNVESIVQTWSAD